jgi:hypothetical protein
MDTYVRRHVRISNFEFSILRTFSSLFRVPELRKAEGCDLSTFVAHEYTLYGTTEHSIEVEAILGSFKKN